MKTSYGLGASLAMAAVLAIACGQVETASWPEPTLATPGTARQEVRSSNKVLILGSSVSGGSTSTEAQAVAAFAPGWPIDVVTPTQWEGMTVEQFMSYRAIIIGDAACTSGTAAFQAAIDTRAKWGPVIDGDIVIVGTNTSSGSKPQLTRNGIEHIIRNSEQYRTGLYVSLGCAYQNAPADTVVTLLGGFGDFRVQGSASNCAATAGHMFQMQPDYLSHFIDDAYLGNGGCAARSVFTTYPVKNFAVATIGLNAPGAREYIDFLVNEPLETPYFGTPYVLVRGATAVSNGCGTQDYAAPDEECDIGDNLNGVPALPDQNPLETCSYSCRRNWCGDGVVDAAFGEECDHGVYNGRTRDAAGTLVNGMCTQACQIVNLPYLPPGVDARCMDVTVPASPNACGAAANINNGSIDLEDGLPDCTQSPAGPYAIGNTTVTLTCQDSVGNTDACSGVVTVRDVTPPTMTLNGQQFLQTQCFTPTDDPRDPDEEIEVDPEPYIDPRATGHDLCRGDVTQSVMTFGEVSKQAPGMYTLEYQVHDGAYNWADPIIRTVEVIDTLAPILKENAPLHLPPDNTMRVVELSQCAIPWDLCEGYLDIDSQAFDLSVTSNDPRMDPNDVVLLTTSQFKVRSRNNVDGSSRVYTATYKVTDSSGNVTQGGCTLNVAAGIQAGR